MTDALAELNTCTRFCEFRHLFGNSYECCSHRQIHVCDKNCKQTIPMDANSRMCRLSKRVFESSGAMTGMEALDTVKRKPTAEQRSDWESSNEWGTAIKRVDSGLR